jgi:hypothetical protein
LENNKKIGTFFDISNGVRKKFLNLNLADIGAKKGFKRVLARICQGKFFYNLNLIDVS